MSATLNSASCETLHTPNKMSAEEKKLPNPEIQQVQMLQEDKLHAGT